MPLSTKKAAHWYLGSMEWHKIRNKKMAGNNRDVGTEKMVNY